MAAAIDPDGTDYGAGFIQLCDAIDIPPSVVDCLERCGWSR